jgi:hypothetical protein
VAFSTWALDPVSVMAWWWGKGALRGRLNCVGWTLTQPWKHGTLGAEVVTIGHMRSGVAIQAVRCAVAEVCGKVMESCAGHMA